MIGARGWRRESRNPQSAPSFQSRCLFRVEATDAPDAPAVAARRPPPEAALHGQLSDARTRRRTQRFGMAGALMSRYVTACHVSPWQDTSHCHTTSCQNVSCCVLSCHAMSQGAKTCLAVLHHVIPFLTTSHYATPHHVSPCQDMSRCVTAHYATEGQHHGPYSSSSVCSGLQESVGEGRLFAEIICWFACHKDNTWEVAFEKAPQLPGIEVTANLRMAHHKRTEKKLQSSDPASIMTLSFVPRNCADAR